jgi:hypothetical protein
MARMVTLSTLQSRVLQRAGLQFASNNATVQTASTTGQQQGELVDNINEGIAALHGLMNGVEGQPYYLSSIPFTTSAFIPTSQVTSTLTSQTYNIGPGQPINVADFYKFRGLDVNFGQNIVITAKPFTWKERNRYKWLGGWVYTQPVFYRMLGNRLMLIPSPGGQYACEMYYTPTPPQLVTLADQFDGVNGWEEYVVLDAAMKLLLKQERFDHVQALMALQDKVKQRILDEAGNRDMEDPERVQDTTLNDGWIGSPGY